METKVRGGPPDLLMGRIVEAVASATETDPLDLPPLYDTLDSQTLAAFVKRLDGGKVHFRYADSIVTVHADGAVDVTEEAPNRLG